MAPLGFSPLMEADFWFGIHSSLMLMQEVDGLWGLMAFRTFNLPTHSYVGYLAEGFLLKYVATWFIAANQ